MVSRATKISETWLLRSLLSNLYRADDDSVVRGTGAGPPSSRSSPLDTRAVHRQVNEGEESANDNVGQVVLARIQSSATAFAGPVEVHSPKHELSIGESLGYASLEAEQGTTGCNCPVIVRVIRDLLSDTTALIHAQGHSCCNLVTEVLLVAYLERAHACDITSMMTVFLVADRTKIS